MIPGDDHFRGLDLIQPARRVFELPFVPASRHVSGDDDHVWTHGVDPLDGGFQEVGVEGQLAAVDVAYLGDPQGILETFICFSRYPRR